MSSQNKILPFKGKGEISATNPNCGLYSYSDTNSPCWQFFDQIRRFVVNAFEPKLNLVVNTGKIKQTFHSIRAHDQKRCYRYQNSGHDAMVLGMEFANF